MKTERLLFHVSPASEVKDFMTEDAETWTPWLERQPGYIGKSVTRVSRDLVEMLIFWNSLEDQERASKKKREMEAVDRVLKGRIKGSYRIMQSS